MSRALLALALTAALAGCRPDPGPSQYNNQESFDGGSANALPGPDPYVPGTPRLSIGWNYESGYSDIIQLDNMTSHLYIYGDQNNTGSVTIQDDKDHVEGLSSQRVTCAGQSFAGFGINWDVVHDLSMWTHMHVSLKSSDPNFADFTIGLNDGEGSATATYTVDLMGQYGWVNDGQWHNLVIPLADFVATGFDPSMATAGFVVGAAMDPSGQALLVDDLFFSAD